MGGILGALKKGKNKLKPGKRVLEGNLEERMVIRNALKYHERALKEIQAGCKKGHWIWYVYPVHARRMSDSRPEMAMKSFSEAQEYLQHSQLRSMYVEILEASLGAMDKHETEQPYNVFDRYFRRNAIGKGLRGPIDSHKVRVSITLFHQAAKAVGDEDVEQLCENMAQRFTGDCAMLIAGSGTNPVEWPLLGFDDATLKIIQEEIGKPPPASNSS